MNSHLIVAIQNPNPPDLFSGRLKPLPFDKATNEGLEAVGQQQPPRPYTKASEPYGRLDNDNRRIQMLYMRGTHAPTYVWKQNRECYDKEGASFENFGKPYEYLDVAQRRFIESKQLHFARQISKLFEGMEQQVAVKAERARYKELIDASEQRVKLYKDGLNAELDGAQAADEEMPDASGVEAAEEEEDSDASPASQIDEFGPGGRFELDEDKALRLGLSVDNAFFMSKVRETQERLLADNPVVSLDGNPVTGGNSLEYFYEPALSQTIQGWPDKTAEELEREILALKVVGDIEKAQDAAEQLRLVKGRTRNYQEQVAKRKRQGKPTDPESVWKALGRTFDDREETKIRTKGDTLRDLSYRLTGFHRSENLQYMGAAGGRGSGGVDTTKDYPLLMPSDFPETTNLGYTKHRRRVKDAVKYPYLDKGVLIGKYGKETPEFMGSDRMGDTAPEERNGDVEVVWFATLQDRAKGTLNEEYLDPETTLRELDYMATAMHSYTPADARQSLPAVWDVQNLSAIDATWKQGGKYHSKIEEHLTWERAAEAAREKGEAVPEMPLLTPPYEILGVTAEATKEARAEALRRPHFARGLDDTQYGHRMDYPTVRQMRNSGVLGFKSVRKPKYYAERTGKFKLEHVDDTPWVNSQNHKGNYVLSYALYPAKEFHALRETEKSELKKMHHRSQIENSRAEAAVAKLTRQQGVEAAGEAAAFAQQQNEVFERMAAARAAEAGPVQKTQAELEREEAKLNHAAYFVEDRWYQEPVDEMWKKVLGPPNSPDIPGPAGLPDEDTYPFYIDWKDAWMHPGYEKDGIRFEEKGDYDVRLAAWEANQGPDALPWKPVQHEASYYRYVRLAPGRDLFESEQMRKQPRSAAVPEGSKEPWGARPLEDAEEWSERQSGWDKGVEKFTFIFFQRRNAELVKTVMDQAAADRARQEEWRARLEAQPNLADEDARALRGADDRYAGDPPSPERQRSRGS